MFLTSIYIIEDDMRGEKICKTKREKCWAGESMMMMTNVGSAQSDWWKRLDDSSKRKARQVYNGPDQTSCGSDFIRLESSQRSYISICVEQDWSAVKGKRKGNCLQVLCTAKASIHK